MNARAFVPIIFAGFHDTELTVDAEEDNGDHHVPGEVKGGFAGEVISYDIDAVPCLEAGTIPARQRPERLVDRARSPRRHLPQRPHALHNRTLDWLIGQVGPEAGDRAVFASGAVSPGTASRKIRLLAGADVGQISLCMGLCAVMAQAGVVQAKDRGDRITSS